LIDIYKKGGKKVWKVVRKFKGKRRRKTKKANAEEGCVTHSL